MKESHFVNGRFLALEAGADPPTALISQGGRIVALQRDPHSPGADAEVIDLRGRTAIPGPVDAHCHLLSYGMNHLREADLRGAESVEEIAERLRAHAARLGLREGDGRWLLG